MSFSCIVKLKTYWKLGITSVAHVAAYRAACKSGLYQRLLPIRAWNGGSLFFSPEPSSVPVISPESRDTLLERAEALLNGNLCYFSVEMKQVGSPPDWLLDPFSGNRLLPGGHWSKLNEFSAADIKTVWEASRFEWVPLLARAWRVSGDRRYIDALNQWMHDWVLRNPVNSGPNWKCGQEASIRTVNLMLGSFLLGTHRSPSPPLVALIKFHCSRIRPTIQYAVAQNNNHGTSEAAALYLGGSWLLGADPLISIALRRQAQQWRDLGRTLLEERVMHLIAPDGSFSQYSVNYHRVLVDTLCQVEAWRQEYDDKPFSRSYTERCQAAVEWLAQVTDVDTGDAPNMGANDGARLYDLSCTEYRDFRPSVQLASLLFNNCRKYGSGTWDEPLRWWWKETSENTLNADRVSEIHKNGGDVVLHNADSHALIRFASFRFRPSHADCLHFDLWHNGQNILRDGGTYSYNTDPQLLDYFSGSRSHNTVQFDGRNQMPRLGRFLFGDWLSMSECGGIEKYNGFVSWTGAYYDRQKAWHRRTVTVKDACWKIIDEIDGFKECAVLRWRLLPDRWQLEDNVCCGRYAQLNVITDAPVKRIELVTGWESLHYQQKTELPVLEIEVGPGRWIIETDIILKD
ncbi:MAG: alginate lyase family protein [Desulfuromonadaceae bacterium]|nr:alginate lyase family protein [Desulfuromonadaceae bacterium]MDD2848564.1 alginate lyase family protein [Desulfuromonadaceae bacterium]MDD4131534.1 alginate lyase family protein [Desulfuromonadaceae bacterium]